MEFQKVKELIKGFEGGTFPAEKWTHEAHFLMALWYLYHHPISEAKKYIKDGIKNYNLSVGGKNTDEEGYHETITEFYIRVMVQYILSFDEGTKLEVMLDDLQGQPFMDKGFPFRYYTKEKLMSKAARKEWVAPDLDHELSFLANKRLAG